MSTRKIEQRLKKAPHGPWRQIDRAPLWEDGAEIGNDDGMNLSVVSLDTEALADFLVHAPDDINALLKRVKELERQLASKP
jgi:hypothetical protein